MPTMEQEAAWADGSAKWAIGRHGEFDQSGNDGGSGNGTERAGEKEDDGDDGVWAILVNQKGWHRRMDIVYRPDKIPWTRFPVGKGMGRHGIHFLTCRCAADEQIRMRLIHGGYRHPLTVHFERHQMEVVAADGNELQPQKVRIVLNSKQIVVSLPVGCAGSVPGRAVTCLPAMCRLVGI